jgi:hypothetical protein
MSAASKPHTPTNTADSASARRVNPRRLAGGGAPCPRKGPPEGVPFGAGSVGARRACCAAASVSSIPASWTMSSDSMPCSRASYQPTATLQPARAPACESWPDLIIEARTGIRGSATATRRWWQSASRRPRGVWTRALAQVPESTAARYSADSRSSDGRVDCRHRAGWNRSHFHRPQAAAQRSPSAPADGRTLDELVDVAIEVLNAPVNHEHRRPASLGDSDAPIGRSG